MNGISFLFQVMCMIFAALIHWFVLAVFCWILAEFLQLYMCIHFGWNRSSSRLKYFAALGWGAYSSNYSDKTIAGPG